MNSLKCEIVDNRYQNGPCGVVINQIGEVVAAEHVSLCLVPGYATVICSTTVFIFFSCYHANYSQFIWK